MTEQKAKEYDTIPLDGIPVRQIGAFHRETRGLCKDAVLTSKLRDGEAESAGISFSFDNVQLFEIRKGDLS